MDPRRLRYFLAIVEAGSLSRAAVVLGVAQPALSQSVAALEAELRVKLLERSSRGVRPTAAGEALVRRGRAVLRDLQALGDELRAEGHEVVGSAVVGLTPTAALTLGEDLIARTARELPRVRLRIEEGGSTALAQALAAGALDMTVTPSAAGPGETLLTEGLSVMAAAPLPAPLDLDALAGLGWIVSSPPNAIRGRLDANFAAAGLAPRIVAEVNSLPLVVRAVSAGLGVSLLPLSLLSAELAKGQLVAHPVPGAPRHSLRLQLRRGPLSLAAGAVADLLRAMAADRAKS